MIDTQRIAAIRKRIADDFYGVSNEDASWLCDEVESLSVEVARLKLQAKGACEVCWTISWEPVKQDDTDAIADGHGGWMRCSYCWHLESWLPRLNATNARLEAISAGLDAHHCPGTART